MTDDIRAELGLILLALLGVIVGVFKFGDQVLRRLSNQRLATLDKYEKLLEEAAALRGDNMLLIHRAEEAEKRAYRYSTLVTQYQYALRKGYGVHSVKPLPTADLTEDLTDTAQITTMVTHEIEQGEPPHDEQLPAELVSNAGVHDLPAQTQPDLHSEPTEETNRREG